MRKRKRYIPRLRKYPDAILFKKSTAVLPDENISPILRDMRYILLNSKSGVGIAAPQAGHSRRVILVKQRVMINPRITLHSIMMTKQVEGCLSCPGVYKKIWRHKGIMVRYLDERREKHTQWFDGVEAQIIQHEIDHLNGKCKVAKI